MKKFKDLLLRRSFSAGGWKPTLLAAGVLCGGAAMAQVVTVPATCQVVVAGTGGTLGLGGTVGNGGIVVMPDPFDITGAGGNFIFSGGTITGWSLLGDLSIQTASSPPTAPVQTAGAVATQNIQSYNKSLRSAETGTPSTLARSKGRVTTTFTGAGCTVMTFDVYKKWGPLVTTPPNNNYGPPIAGPACWPSTNQLVAFSVDQIESDNILDAIGTDQYYWKLTNGLGVDVISTQPTAYYMAADRSSVTCNMSTAAFITWYSGGPYSIRCCYARSFPAWDNGTGLTSATATDCVSKPINSAPTAPTFTTLIPTCLLYSATSFSAVFTGVTDHTYSWTSTCGWVIAQTGTVPGPMTLNVTGVNQGPCTLILTDVGPCGSNIYS